MNQRNSLLFWGIFLSLILHLSAAISSYWIPANWIHPSASERIEFEITEPEKQPEPKQFVQKFEAPEPEEEPEKIKAKARFLSDKLRRFRQELQASQIGETRNQPAVPKNLRPQWRPSLRDSQQRENTSSPESSFDPMGAAAFPPRIQSRSAAQFSTIGETLPKDIQKGQFNILNTDQLTFYSFYERFGELVRFSWARQLEMLSANSSVRQIMANSSNRRWTSEMKVWLKPNGEVARVALMKPSGIPLLDRAHVQTFYDVKLVPNPPREMVEEDQITIDVALTIFYDP